MTFTYDLDQMKEAVDSGVVSIPVEALTSFESFDKWFAGDVTRIDELKKQCYICIPDRGHGEDCSYDMNKFAKLIIDECASLTLDYKNEDHYNGWLDFRDEIRKHFGVS